VNLQKIQTLRGVLAEQKSGECFDTLINLAYNLKKVIDKMYEFERAEEQDRKN
jgi:hypothetical protein